MGKPKMTGEVSVMEASQSPHGVLTRAQTLALQRRGQSSDTAPPASEAESCYLELRSRRLQKLKPLTSPRKARSSYGCSRQSEMENEMERSTRESTPCGLIMSADNIPFPCSIRKKKFAFTSNQNTRNASVANTSVPEVEELFLQEQQSLQRLFLEKYNFDVANEMPLPGRYEWVSIRN